MHGKSVKTYTLKKFSTRTLPGEGLKNVALCLKKGVNLSANEISFEYLLTFWFIKN